LKAIKDGVEKPKELILKYYTGPGTVKDTKTLEKERADRKK
jgi:hypothetical protein